MASLIEAIEIKRKTFFEYENAPYHCIDVEVSKPTARGGQTLGPVCWVDPNAPAVNREGFLTLDAAGDPVLYDLNGNIVAPGDFVIVICTGGQYSAEEILCDFADPRARIDFEIDGFAYHSSPAQIARDKARDRKVMRAGWLPVRYQTDDIRRRPTETVADALHQIAVRMTAR